MLLRLGRCCPHIFGLHVACRMTLPGLLISLEEAVMVRSISSDLVHKILHAASRRKEDRLHLLLWEYSPPLVSIFPVWEGWQTLSAALPPPLPLSFLICRCTDGASVTFMGQRKERSAEPSQLNSTPWKTLLFCNLSYGLEECFSLLVIYLGLDLLLAAELAMWDICFIIWVSFDLWGLRKGSQHRCYCYTVDYWAL